MAEPITAPVGPGARRVAAALLGLGPETAKLVFTLLGEQEVRRIATAARDLKREPPDAVPHALQMLIDGMDEEKPDVIAGDEVLRDAAMQALGPEVARRAFEGTMPPPEPDEVLGPVALADPEALAMVLSREHAQTVALVLSAIDSERAAATMAKLPATLRPLVVARMASVDAVAPEVLREVGQALAHELRAVVAGGVRRVDGRKAATEMLRRASGEEQVAVLEAIERDDAPLAAELRTKLLTFDDLIHLADRDVQTILKDVDAKKLTMALKGASNEVREKILRNMSERASQMLRDDLLAAGPVRLSLVEEAQGEIVRSVQALSEQGRITLVRPADKMV